MGGKRRWMVLCVCLGGCMSSRGSEDGGGCEGKWCVLESKIGRLGGRNEGGAKGGSSPEMACAAGVMKIFRTACGTSLASHEVIGSPAQVPRPQTPLDCARRQEGGESRRGALVFRGFG